MYIPWDKLKIILRFLKGKGNEICVAYTLHLRLVDDAFGQIKQILSGFTEFSM